VHWGCCLLFVVEKTTTQQQKKDDRTQRRHKGIKDRQKALTSSFSGYLLYLFLVEPKKEKRKEGPTKRTKRR